MVLFFKLLTFLCESNNSILLPVHVAIGRITFVSNTLDSFTILVK